MDTQTRRKWIYGYLAFLGLVAAFLVYALHIAMLMHYAQISGCNATSANITRTSMSGFVYGLNPGNWDNISNYLNQSCNQYQLAIEQAIIARDGVFTTTTI